MPDEIRTIRGGFRRRGVANRYRNKASLESTRRDPNLDALAVAERHNLGVSEALAILGVTFVGNKHPVAIGHEVDKVETVNPFAVRPATRKISDQSGYPAGW